MTQFGDIHECECVYDCGQRAAVYALFRGSLSLACADHIGMVLHEYNATLYNRAGEVVTR